MRGTKRGLKGLTFSQWNILLECFENRFLPGGFAGNGQYAVSLCRKRMLVAKGAAHQRLPAGLGNFIFCIPSAQTKGVRAGFAMKQISEGNSHALSGQFDPQLLKRPGGEHDFIRCVRIVAMDLSNSRRDMPLPFRLIVG